MPVAYIVSIYAPTGVARIIEPLASRCSKFRFKPLDSSSARDRLEHIAAAEQVPVNRAVISALISTSSGDLRRAITYLQSAARLSSATDPPTPILAGDIQEIAGVVPDAVVRKFAQTLGVDVSLIGSGDEDVEMDDLTSSTTTTALRGFDLIRETVRSLVREGYSASRILIQVCSLVFHIPS
jgi:replication factor C subunit 2/4